MATRVGIVDGDDHLVALAGADLVVAPGTAVRLHRLVRLHVADLDRVGVILGEAVGHGSAAEEGPDHEPGDHHERDRDHDDVGPPRHLAPERVQSHGSTVPGKSGGAAMRAAVMLGAWNR